MRKKSLEIIISVKEHHVTEIITGGGTNPLEVLDGLRLRPPIRSAPAPAIVPLSTPFTIVSVTIISYPQLTLVLKFVIYEMPRDMLIWPRCRHVRGIDRCVTRSPNAHGSPIAQGLRPPRRKYAETRANKTYNGKINTENVTSGSAALNEIWITRRSSLVNYERNPI